MSSGLLVLLLLCHSFVNAGMLADKAPSTMETELGWAKQVREAQIVGAVVSLGRPEEYARLVHKQAGMTCAVVAVQEVLLAYDVLPFNQDLAGQQEDTLFNEANQKGYYLGARNEIGSGLLQGKVDLLLQDHGLTAMPRHSESELVEALTSGKIVIADMDMGALYYDRNLAGKIHTIVVTGLKRLERDGPVLGFDINDSSYEAGQYAADRIVPAEAFRRAWVNGGGTFIEVIEPGSPPRAAKIPKALPSWVENGLWIEGFGGQ